MSGLLLLAAAAPHLHSLVYYAVYSLRRICSLLLHNSFIPMKNSCFLPHETQTYKRILSV